MLEGVQLLAIAVVITNPQPLIKQISTPSDFAGDLVAIVRVEKERNITSMHLFVKLTVKY